MNHKIRHEGIVDSIEEGCVHVRILQTSACASCKVAGYCNAAEAKEKIVDVFQTKGSSLKVGDAVTVSASGDVAARALLWAFGLPFLLMVTVLVLVLWQTHDEGGGCYKRSVVINTILRTVVPAASPDAQEDGVCH